MERGMIMSQQTIDKSVDSKELYDHLDEYLVVDVRSPAEFREVHISGSLNIPVDELDRSMPDLRDKAQSKKIALVCRKGIRSKAAYSRLQKENIPNSYALAGGIDSWLEAGCAVVEGPKTMSLERQVRIGAGAFVLTGVILGAFIHPAFLVIAAIVGAGLVYAGITDTCLLANLLSAMPWNRK